MLKPREPLVMETKVLGDKENTQQQDSETPRLARGNRE